MPRFFVSTPIYYVNDVPHIGHAYTTIVADALARWHRLLGDDVHFVTGTDEHGLKMVQAAQANGTSAAEWADRMSLRFVETWDLLNISRDDFIRTTEARHYRAVQKLWQKIYENGDVYLGSYEGHYCVACEAYYTDEELVEQCCPIHTGRPVSWVKEENYFFRLSAYEQRLLDFYEANPEAVRPQMRLNEVLGFIRGGLRDFSISRKSLTWGVPLPWDDRHVAYVWADALVNYCTSVGYESEPPNFDRWWPEVRHLIGKDILRFHSVYWPAMLMAAGLTPPKQVFAHGWLLVGGEKMSKTKLNQIAPADLVADFGVDGFRYHFLRDASFGPDGDFSYEAMVARYNSDLANNLGNLLSRVTKIITTKCDSRAPACRIDSPLRSEVEGCVENVERSWLAVAPHEALLHTWGVIRAANAFLEENEPWKLEPSAELDVVLGDALEALRIATVLASVAIPESADEILRRIGLRGVAPGEANLLEWGSAGSGQPVVSGPPLFPRMKSVTTSQTKN